MDRDRAAVFGLPVLPLDRMHRYMRAGLNQVHASVAAWAWPAYAREHAVHAVDHARAWGQVADLINAALVAIASAAVDCPPDCRRCDS